MLACTLMLLPANPLFSQEPSVAELEEQVVSVRADTRRVDLMNQLAHKLLELNQLDKGAAWAQQAYTLADSLDYQAGKARSFENRALYYTYDNRLPLAISLYDSSGMLYGELRDSVGLVRVLNETGGVYYKTFDYRAAMECFSNSLFLLDLVRDSLALADTYNRIGLVYFARGQYEEALESFMAALQLCRPLGDELGVSKAYCYMGMVYIKLREYQKAGEILAAASELNQKAGPTRDIIEVYGQLGVLKQELGMHAEALQLFKKGLGLARYYNDPAKVAGCLNSIGASYHAQQDFETALGFYRRALDILNEQGTTHGLVQTSNNMARAYTDMVEARKSGRFNNFSVSIVPQEEIFTLLNNSLSSARKSGSFNDLVGTYEMLIRASATFGEFQDAVKYQGLMLNYKDSVAGIYREQSVAQLQADFEREQAEQELALLNSEKKVQETVMKRQQVERYFYFGGGAALVLLIIGLMNRLNFVNRTRKELQRKNDQIEEEKTRAQQSENIKEQFLAKMSHEIRIPMNTIMGSVNIIMNGKHTKAQKKYLKAIYQSSENLMVIINDILDLTKLEAGKVTLDETPFIVRDEVKNIDQIFRFRAEEKGIRFKSTVEEQVPEALVGDSTRLSQVLINLAGNGIKFTEKGKVSLHVSVLQVQGEVYSLRFAVTDTGIGIPADRCDKIFQSFTQADSDTNRKYGGTGLGLTISKQLVELQGGSIHVESKPGEGSTFWFQVPYRLAAPTTTRENPAAAVKKIKKLEGLRLLVVEDDEFNVMVLEDTLSASLKDIRVEVALSGEEALEKWNTQPFDLILMDIELPGISGHEVTRTIRSDPKNGADIPIIAMTANAMQKEVEACFLSGMNDYVPKPFDPDELILKINSNLINRKNN